jgi:hypothetical protein
MLKNILNSTGDELLAKAEAPPIRRLCNPNLDLTYPILSKASLKISLALVYESGVVEYTRTDWFSSNYLSK